MTLACMSVAAVQKMSTLLLAVCLKKKKKCIKCSHQKIIPDAGGPELFLNHCRRKMLIATLRGFSLVMFSSNVPMK